jgi:hypothetical protein
LEYSIDKESKNPLDNIHIVKSDKIFIINISTFMTATRFEHDNYYEYDLREPPRKIIHPDRVKTNKSLTTTDNWTNIPFYPTAEKKREMIKQYGQAKAEEIIEYSYNNSTDPTKPVMPPPPPSPSNQNPRQNPRQNPVTVTVNQGYIPNVNKYSPVYARIIGAKPKATASANIRLGGLY